MALTLLTGSVIMAATLYQTSLDIGRKIEKRLDAAYIARQELVAVRQWLKDFDHFRNPTGYPNTEQDRDGFKTKITLTPMETASPNRSFEEGYAVKRQLRSSYLKVDVSVRRGTDDFRLSSIVGTPRRELSIEPVKIDALVSSMAKDERAKMQVRLLDSSGREIEDVFFQWSVRPVDGVANLRSVSRDGKEATLLNRSVKRDGTPIWTGGTCKIWAGTTYAGKEVGFESSPILLDK